MILATCNHKGGTGKTTTVINLASALVKKGKKVLLIDFDPQGNLSYSLGLESTSPGLAQAMVTQSKGPLPVQKASEKLHVLTGGVDLYNVEDELHAMVKAGNYTILSAQLEKVKDQYDFIIIDCPPSFSIYTSVALVAADYTLIPVQLDVLSIQGLTQMINYVELIKTNYNSRLEILGIVAVIVDERRQLTFEVLEHVKANFKVYVFNHYVRSNVKAAEAPSFAKSVVDYAPDSNSAKDYVAVANELLKVMKNENTSAPGKKEKTV